MTALRQLDGQQPPSWEFMCALEGHLQAPAVVTGTVRIVRFCERWGVRVSEGSA